MKASRDLVPWPAQPSEAVVHQPPSCNAQHGREIMESGFMELLFVIIQQAARFVKLGCETLRNPRQRDTCLGDIAFSFPWLGPRSAFGCRL
jgi:hypothetical protein